MSKQTCLFKGVTKIIAEFKMSRSKEDALFISEFMSSNEETSSTIKTLSRPEVCNEPRIQHIPELPQKPPIYSLIKSRLSSQLSLFPSFLCSIKFSQEYINYCLLKAAKHNSPEFILFLLSGGWRNLKADPSFKGKDGKNALHIAAERGNYAAAVVLIKKNPRLVDTNDRNKRNALAIACKNSHSKIAVLLLKKGCSLNSRDYLGNTPLHYLLSNGLEEALAVAKELSPDYLAKNHVGETPIDLVSDPRLVEDLGNLKAKKLDLNLTLNDFLIIRRVGRGSFGEVCLVKHKETGDVYAMKVLYKRKLFRENLLVYALTERNVLSYANSPFLVHLKFAFQSETHLFLVMDYCPGGNLMQCLKREGRLCEKTAKVYAAEILLAIESLHRQDVLYRDLKPENVVFDENGHIKLTDFGLAKEKVKESSVTSSFCGSLAYIPPEILNHESYGKAVDWYLFGEMLFEMLVGFPPFYSDSKPLLFRNIRKQKVRVPYIVGPYARNLIKRLLHKDPKQRLTGAENIKKHRFFQDLDWDCVLQKKARVPEPIFVTEGPNCNFLEKNKPAPWVADWDFIR